LRRGDDMNEQQYIRELVHATKNGYSDRLTALLADPPRIEWPPGVRIAWENIRIGVENLTLAHIAAENGHTGILVELATMRANLNALDATRRTPADRAVDAGKPEILKTLERLGARVSPPATRLPALFPILPTRRR
jgi:hypothetical protein